MKKSPTGTLQGRTNGRPPVAREGRGSGEASAPASATGPEARDGRRLDGTRVGRLVGFSAMGEGLVDFPGNRQGNAVNARTATLLGPEDLGKEVVLLFDDGDVDQPIIMGVIRPSVEGGQPSAGPQPPLEGVRVEVDGKTLTFSAASQVVLRCGAASITLTEAGKVIIDGAYVLSRSSGVNKIKGGSIQLN